MIGSTVSFKDRKDKWDIDIKHMQQTIGHNFIGISTATNIFPNYVLQQILNMQISSQLPSNTPKSVKRKVKLDDEFRKEVEKEYNKKQIKEETTPKRSKKKEKQITSKKKCINLAELANKADIQCNRQNKNEKPAVQNQQNENFTFKLERAQAKIVQLQKQKQMLANKNRMYLKENQQLTIKITYLKEEYRSNQFDKQNLITLINQINQRREQGVVDQVHEMKQIKSNEEYCKILQQKCIQLLEENERICQIYQKSEQQSNMLKQKAIVYERQLAKNKIEYETKRNEMESLYKSNKMSSDSTALMIKTLQQTLGMKQNEIDNHIKQKQKEVKKLQEQLCKSNEQMSKIRADSNYSKSQNMKKIQQIQSLHVVLASKEEKINGLNQQLKRLVQFDLKQRQAEIGRLNLICKQQGCKIQQLTQIADNCRKMEERLRSMEAIKMENEVNLKKSQTEVQRLHNQLIRCRQESELKMNELKLLKVKQIQGIKSTYSLTQMQQKTKIAGQSIQISQIRKKNSELLAQLQQTHQRQKRSESYMTELQVQLKKRDQQIRKWQQQVIEQQRLMKNKMEIVGRTNHTDRHELQESIKFLTEEVEIWSKKYESLIEENGNLKNKLQSYVGMYEIMAKKGNSVESSVNNSFISVTSQKQYRQLIRQLESSKVELQVMKHQKQQIESTLNKQLNKRKQIIESLIKDRKQSYTHTSS